MPERLNRSWRVVATGLCFASFGLGGLVLRLVVFPLLAAMVRDPRRRAWRSRRLIRRSFRLFIAMMSGLGVLSYELRGAERLRRRGLLVLANHPTLVDVVFLMAFVERADCIVKGALALNPFTRGPVRAAGFVCNDSGEGLLGDCLASLRDGGNLIVFPEGTRTPRQGRPRLRRGAAHVAVRGGVDVTPVHIRVEPLTLGKGEPWWRVPPRRPHFVFEVGDDIPVRHFVGDGVAEPLSVRRLTDHLTHHFASENPRAAA
ncbi:1-acyl-sn-glycerol-3-phosphate acyltransferase [Rubrivivax gelatinosus]|uniref:lysophospholipid acyltransferase family protein n=1 Tax=Rubrivivax gelatinosus TaxID=28068 RepID=UPI0019033DCD|nr:lysophospholipid acyltransferase family protein [Rubrivivax gelatinosus]MBK1612122.1 1-acyl-sn-glycerol-3-phosphate acyltransferase [Rubrivivax gelatinosus]